MYKGKGRLVYDPRTEVSKFTSWTAKVDVHPSIIQYYQAWIRKELKVNVNTPIWKAHITVIRGERPPNIRLWNKYQGEVMDFEYCPEFQSSDIYFWLKVTCPRLNEIREELGLNPQPRVPLHMTIGNMKNVEPAKKKNVPFVVFPWETRNYVDSIVKPYRMQ